MSSVSTINVPFHGNNLYVVNYNGEPYVPMKPVVDGMGLAWQSQLEKIKLKFKSTVTEIVIVAADGKERSMVCLAFRKFAAWLNSIMPNKVKPEIRNRVIQYQEECDDVLYEYWTTGEVKKTGRSTVQERNPLKDAINLLVSKRGIMYPEAYSLVHKHFSITSIDELTSDQIPNAVKYVHGLVLDGEFIGKSVSDKCYQITLESDELCNLTWLWVAANYMMEHIERVEQPLRDLQSPLAATFFSMSREYQRVLTACKFILNRETKNITYRENNISDMGWARALPVLRK
ncbi:Phage anti-repressor protein [Providencia rettgeri]|nr:Phage anti-repressor protein [Providencia rettgeri]